MAMKKPGAFAPLSAYYFDDAAIMDAGEDAELLYVRMLAYAARQLEHEGFISDQVLESRLGIIPRRSGNDAGNVPGTDAGSRAGVLCDVGLLDRVDGGYRIHSWLKWNRSAQEMGKERARDRSRKQRPTSNDPETVRESVRETGRENFREPGSNDQTRPDQTNTPTGGEAAHAPIAARQVSSQTIVAAWIDTLPQRPPGRVIGQVAKEIKTMLDEGIDPDLIRAGVAEWQRKGLHPSTLASVVHEISTPHNRADSTTERVMGWLDPGILQQSDRRAIGQ